MKSGTVETLLLEKNEKLRKLNTAIITGYLLTGSTAGAEAAVTEAIHRWESSSTPGSFLQAVAEAASKHDDVPLETWALPNELQNVMHLPRDHRRCFVLRILLGLPKWVCTRMLGSSEEEVDRYTCEALWRLADTVSGKHAGTSVPMSSIEGISASTNPQLAMK